MNKEEKSKIKYEKLRVLKYNSGFDVDAELSLRKNPYNTIFPEFSINPFFSGEVLPQKEYELFCNNIEEIRTLNEKIIDMSSSLEDIASNIPGGVHNSVIRKIIVNEIQSTNDIEGVKSTKEELRSAMDLGIEGKGAKFYKIVNMYTSILEYDYSNAVDIDNVHVIREIYDNLFKDSNTVDEYVDGDLFRSETTYIQKNNKIIHKGVNPDRINECMERLVGFMKRKDVPFLMKACISHYMIEYIHPFYDGNGRLGRFLMSVYLKRKLDIYSALSISYGINQNRGKYKKLFTEVTKISNYGELTHFVLGLFDLIYDGQKSIKRYLENSLNRLDTIGKNITDLASDGVITSDESNILYLYAQIYTFNEHDTIKDGDVVNIYRGNVYSKTEITNIIKSLEKKGYLVLLSKRPKVHEISKEIKLLIE